MKLIYYPLDMKCDFFPDQLNRIVMEDKEVFGKFLFHLSSSIRKEDECFYLEEKDKVLQIDKTANLIASPFDLIYNKREYQKVLFNKMIEEIQVEGMQDSMALHLAGLLQNLEVLRNNLMYQIELDEEIDYSDIFKLFNVEIQHPKGTFVEKMLDFMGTALELLQRRIFFVANCDAYIESKWYEEIVKWASYQNVIVIFLENKQMDSEEKINEYILDRDLCVLH